MWLFQHPRQRLILWGFVLSWSVCVCVCVFAYKMGLFPLALTLQAHGAPPMPSPVRRAWNGTRQVVGTQDMFTNKGWKALVCRALCTGMGSLRFNSLREARTLRQEESAKASGQSPLQPSHMRSGTDTQPSLSGTTGTQRENSDAPSCATGLSRCQRALLAHLSFPFRATRSFWVPPSPPPTPSSEAAGILLVLTQLLIFLLLLPPFSCSPTASTHQQLIPRKLSLGAISTSY